MMMVLNLICLAMAVWQTLSPAAALAHPSVCYHGLLWAHVAFGMSILLIPTAWMRHTLTTWIAVLRVPVWPTGIRALNAPVVFGLLIFFVGFDQVGMAAAIVCQSIIMFLYRQRHDRLVDLAHERSAHQTALGSPPERVRASLDMGAPTA